MTIIGVGLATTAVPRGFMGILITLLATFCAGGVATAQRGGLPYHRWAETPPLGWNSWDCFGAGVTEQEVRDNADYIQKNLLKHGWTLVTVDIDWFVPGIRGWNYIPGAEVTLDEYGRPVPSPDRFPSAAGGKGFKPLADDIHRQGLKFGVHLLRGIPRKAVERNLPILGTKLHAGDVADKTSLCPWNPDMYGVDMTKPGAQEYYDSLFHRLAEWGVDFVKVDDLSTPYHLPEIEAIRKAIDRCKRPMVFSTSPGATVVSQGAHIASHANMWRISDDFWDNWSALKEQFERLDHWTPFRGPGHWPDADMLPIGAVRQDQAKPWTYFTKDEQFTLMSLWSIGRSPLILGGNLPKNDEFTLSLITNDEVLAVNQHSSNNRQLWRRGDKVAWVADVPHSKDKYVGLFNAADKSHLELSRAAFASELVTRDTVGNAAEISIDLKGAKKLYLYADATSDGNFGDHVVYAEPVVTTPDGEVKLTNLKWDSATQGYGATNVNKSVTGHSLVLDGKEVPFGIGTHATSMIEYTLPDGATHFRVKAGLEQEGVKLRNGATVKFYVFTQDPEVHQASDTDRLSVTAAELGLTGPLKVRDLWKHEDLGEFAEAFSADLPWHGAGLYRVSGK